MNINIKQKFALFLSHAFNISAHELPRVVISWLLKFFLQIALVVGGTMLTALFVDKFHVASLPNLYIVQSLFLIVSVVLLSPVLEAFSRKRFIILSALGAMATFLALLFIQGESLWFFGVFVVALSVFIAQLSIALSLFIEELFSPLESERTFPLIESSEPIGSLAAGVLIIAGIHYFDVYDLLFVLIGSVFCMLPILLIFVHAKERVPILRSAEDVHQKISRLESLKRLLNHAKIIPYLKILVFFVFLSFTAFNILEFQFTKAVDAHVDHGDAHASALTHGLGSVHIVISLVLLITQVFFSARIMTGLGIVRTMALNPLLAAVSFFVMLFKFSYIPAVGAKMVFEVSGALAKNAQLVSLFSLKEKIRANAKEFLEGISRPLGAIVGTFLIIILQFFLPEEHLDQSLNFLLVTIAGLMFFLTVRMSAKYTHLARKNLEMHGAPQDKLDAIEILAQKGHENATEILIKELTFRRDVPEIKARILQTLGILRDPNALPVIIQSLEDREQAVQLSALSALSQFKNLGEHFLSQSFTKFHVTEVLKNLFIKTRSKKTKTAIVHAFTSLNHVDVIPFLIEALKSEDEAIRTEGVFACGIFHDPTVVFYIEKYLNDASPRVRSNCIISLWQFVHLRLKLIVALTTLLESKNEDELLSGIFTVGEIGLNSEEPRLIKLLEHENEDIRRHAAVALGKIDNEISIPQLLDFVWHHDKKTALKVKNQIKVLPRQIRKKIEGHLVRQASREIADLLKNAQTEIIEDLPTKILKELLHIFALIDEDREVLRIKSVLEEKKKARAAKKSAG